MITSADIESFLDIPIHNPSDGSANQLELLLATHEIQIDQLVIQFLGAHEDILMINFLNRIQHYSGATEILVQSVGFVEILTLVSSSRNPQLIVTVLGIFTKLDRVNMLPSNSVDGLIHSCLQWTSHENIALSNESSRLLTNLALLKLEHCDLVIREMMTQHLSIDLDTTIKMRYLGIISEIMATGKEEWFNICIRRGATEAVSKACETPDILSQMIALEYLPSVMSCSLGLDFLTTVLVSDTRSSTPLTHLDWLLESSSENGDDYLRAQCLTCTATLLSNLEKFDHPFCRKTSETSHSSRYFTTVVPSFLKSVCNLLESSIETEKLNALSSLSLYATSSSSAFLNTLSYSNLITTWVHLLRSQPSLQAPTLHSIAQVLLYPYNLKEIIQTSHSQSNAIVSLPICQHPPVRKEQLASSFLSQLTRHDQNNEEFIASILASLHPLKKALFDEIGAIVGRSSSVECLVKLARQPIPETKIGAIAVLRSLAYQDNIWGLQTLMGNVGFYNYIQDRTTEYSLEGKDWKFTLIWAIFSSPNSDLLSNDVLHILQHMISQGPYYMPPRLEEPMTEEKGSS